MARFTTRMPIEGDAYDGKLVMTRNDVRAWVAAGKPAMSGKQMAALARSVAYTSGEDPEATVALAKATRATFLLSQPPARPPSPARVESNPTSSRPTRSGRTSGNGPGAKMQTASKLRKRARKQLRQIRKHLLDAGANPAEVKIMCQPDADPALRRLWLGLEPQAPTDSRAGARTLDADFGEQARLMAGADQELQDLWLTQLSEQRYEDPDEASTMGMNEDRLKLHQDATRLSQTTGKSYGDSVIQLADEAAGAIWLAS